METRRHDTAVRIGNGDARRWQWLTAVALVSVLVWTAVLGLILADRRRDASVEAVASVDHSHAAQPEPPSVAPAGGAIDPPLEAASTTVAGDSGKLAAARPKSYSSIDTQTAARAREDVLGGKREPASDGSPAVTPESTPAGAPAVSLTDLASSPAKPHIEPQPAPRVQPLRVEPLKPSAPRVELARTPPSAREAPVQRALEPSARDVPVMLDYRGAAQAGRAAEPAARAGAQSRIGDPRPGAPSQPQEAVAAQLDASWEQRERWLRERLQQR